MLTGLRRGELASLTVGQVELGGAFPCIVLDAGDEKNGEGSTLPLRSDLAEDLRQWIAEKRDEAQGVSQRAKRISLPMAALDDELPLGTLLFTVPTQLVKAMNRDLAAAGIPKVDERGRTLDVHALRHSFGTLLSVAEVAPRTAQEAMRHSRIDLTMKVYTDPKLLDVAGAMEALPDLPLVARGFQSARTEQIKRATGTDGPSQFAPEFAPTAGKPGNLESSADKVARKELRCREEVTASAGAAKSIPDKRNDSLSSPNSESSKGWLKGLEPSTLRATI